MQCGKQILKLEPLACQAELALGLGARCQCSGRQHLAGTARNRRVPLAVVNLNNARHRQLEVQLYLGTWCEDYYLPTDLDKVGIVPR